MKKFKVSYSYPLEYPIKVVIRRLSKQGLIGWLVQKYGPKIKGEDIVVSERIIELPMLHQWLGKIFSKSEGNLLEIGHVASSAALELASLGFNVTAIDLRDYPFKHPNLLSLKGNFLKFKFDKKFNCIYSLSTIEHLGFSERYGGKDSLDHNLDELALKKIADLLELGGKAIISVPYAKSSIFDTWFRVYTKADLRQKLDKYFKMEESRFYSRKDNEWSPVPEEVDGPVSPHDGVALFLLSKK
jgi:hypothetical protein